MVNFRYIHLIPSMYTSDLTSTTKFLVAASRMTEAVRPAAEDPLPDV